MDPRHLGIDQRLVGMCVHCGDEPTTRDHIPAKVLLDEPYPLDLPVVESCTPCNGGGSLDEQYVACFVEAVLAGAAEVDAIRRPKIKRILSEDPALSKRIASAMSVESDGTKLWRPETSRVQNVILKLARGHSAYELYPKVEPPDRVQFRPLPLLSAEERESFETASASVISPWPELGSRAFMRAAGANPDRFQQSGEWIVVQAGRYRYAVRETGGVHVRMVLSEYLGAEVIWED